VDKPLNDLTFSELADAAGRLLTDGQVASWVARTHPIVVVDEMQDSDGGQLEMLRGLFAKAHIFCAADDFQNLFSTGVSPSIAWAHEIGVPFALDGNHRTSQAGLLSAASAVRSSGTMPMNGTGLRVRFVDSAPLGGAVLAYAVLDARKHGAQSIAVLAARKPETDVFVRGVVAWAASAEGRGKKSVSTVPCVNAPWESGSDSALASVLELFAGCSVPQDVIDIGGAITVAQVNRKREIAGWLSQVQRLQGIATMPLAEFSNNVRRLEALRRSHTTRERELQAMTIHQAKNREFDSVIVLWPYTVPGDGMSKRRLLYNAITRAKRSALIIVQGKDGRASEPPFAPDLAVVPGGKSRATRKKFE